MRTLARQEHDSRRDLAFVTILVIVAAVLHSVFHFGKLYGEHDAARFVVDGIIWAKTGVRSIALSEYRYFVSPGFIVLAKLAYQAGSATGIHPELFLDLLTNAAAVILFIPAYYLFAGLIGASGAFAACCFLEIVPAFWFSSLYGFPTAIALCFVVTALWLWDRFLVDGARNYSALALTFAAALVAMLLKADTLVLSAPAFAGLVLVRRGWAWRELMIGGVVAGAATAAGYLIGHALVQDSVQAAAYAASWNQQFDPTHAAGIGLGRTSYVDELRLYAMSLGLMTLPAVLVALAVMLFEKQQALALAIAIWMPASFLFWAWRPGDGSRHHVPAAVPAALAFGYLVAVAIRGRYRVLLCGFLALVVLINTFRYPASANAAMPSGRLFTSAKLVRADAERIQREADEYVNDNCDAVLLGSPLTPYSEAALLLRTQSFSVKPEQVHGYLVREFDYKRDARDCRSTNVRVLSLTGAEKAAEFFRSTGRTVRSYEYRPAE